VAEAKAQYRLGRHRVYRPWVTEPGLWLQWDWGSATRKSRIASELADWRPVMPGA
jgi:hypothetical protein